MSAINHCGQFKAIKPMGWGGWGNPTHTPLPKQGFFYSTLKWYGVIRRCLLYSSSSYHCLKFPTVQQAWFYQLHNVQSSTLNTTPPQGPTESLLPHPNTPDTQTYPRAPRHQSASGRNITSLALATGNFWCQDPGRKSLGLHLWAYVRSLDRW